MSNIYILTGKKIKRLGGKDLKYVVFTAWHFILSVELRAKFNWLGNPRAGKETKRGLENTNVKKAVFGNNCVSYFINYLYYNVSFVS